MANSPPASAGPRTLFEAKNEIARLRAALTQSLPAGSPVPKTDPQPTGGAKPIPKDPGNPHPNPHPWIPVNPENVNGKALASLIESRSTAELFKMIRESNNARIMAAIRKELGDRGAA